MHILNATERIENIDGVLWRIVTGHYKETSLDIFRESEDGYTECRNLFTSIYGGSYFILPDERCPYGRDNLGLEEWGECNINISAWTVLTESDEKVIVEKYNDFKYVLKKWKSNCKEVFKILRKWKQYKNVELLLGAGLTTIALTDRFYSLSQKKQKEIINYLKTNDWVNMSLNQVLTCLKYKLSFDEYKEYDEFCAENASKFSYPVYKYFRKQIACYGEDITHRLVQEYRDHLKMCKDLKKKDDYWIYPPYFPSCHQKLIKEWNDWNKYKEESKVKEKQKVYFDAIKELRSIKEIDGYTVYVPERVSDIKRHAEYLHQCLITCDYIQKVIDKKCILLFVKKEGVPVATAEIKGTKLKDGKIGQFYANELNRNNCLPTEEVKTAVHKFLAEVA